MWTTYQRAAPLKVPHLNATAEHKKSPAMQGFLDTRRFSNDYLPAT